ncbi:RNA polymerase II transcription factor B subunit 4 [Spiromyces aspiralis]|uniref:RNA polymerase II transcription factor B subunit 4 n=1 Tax=Spiromyces aspiralis TaxID=68401 RepID=A0ACC1HPM3_9FUNG|nr:RNA polymerase II transcription factor B subunit 4 [Spiromyces aspiralis]
MGMPGRDHDVKDPSLLTVIVDVNPFQWADCPLPLDAAMRQIVVFFNAYLALKPQNQLAIIAASTDACRFVYPTSGSGQSLDTSSSSSSGTSSGSTSLSTVYHRFRKVNELFIAGIQDMVSKERESPGRDASTSMIASAMSRALCYANRVAKANPFTRYHSRLLILSVSDDASSQYIQIMNAIFSAQKSHTLIDVAKVHGPDSIFLQQAADITQGNYLRLSKPEGLLGYLMTSFLPDHYTRTFIYLPGKDQVDFRAACFCHKHIIDVGYVCSVCLSIFCKFMPECTTCNTRFEKGLASATPDGVTSATDAFT